MVCWRIPVQLLSLCPIWKVVCGFTSCPSGRELNVRAGKHKSHVVLCDIFSMVKPPVGSTSHM